MSEINQKLGFDASSAITALRNLQGAMNGANQAMSTMGGGVGKFTSKAQPMMAMLDRMGASAGKITGLLDRLGMSANKAALGIGQMAKPQGFAQNMKYLDEIAKKAKLAKEAQAAAAAAPPTGPINNPPVEKVRLFGKAWQDVFNMFKSMLMVQALRSIVSELTGAVEAARKFGLAIAEIQTIGQGLGQTNDQISQSVLNLSNMLGKSAQDVAEGLYQVISNQVVEAADAVKFLEEAEKLAITTHATTAESVDALSSVMNSYSLTLADTNRISGVLFETVNLGRLRLSDIADRIGRITPMAAQMGVRFQEVGAAIAVMTVQGVKADTAITQLRAIMSKLQKPTVELQKVFRSWGVKDGPEAIRTFGGLAGVLKKLSQETGGSSSEMAEFFNVVRAMTGVMSLNTDEGRKFADTLKKMDGATNKAREAWLTFIESDAQDFTREVNELKNVFLELGKVLMPIAKAGAEFFNAMLSGVGQGFNVLGMAFDRTKATDMYIQKYKEALNKKRQEQEKEYTRFESKEWRDREQIVRESLAKMGVEFEQFLKQFEIGQKASTEVFKSFTSDIEGNFEEALNKLKDFSKSADDTIKSNLSSMKDIDREIQDISFEGVLNKADSALKKVDLISQRAFQTMNEGIAESWDAGIDPEKMKGAMDTLKRAAGQAREAISAAGGDPRLEARARQNLTTILLEQSTILQKYNKALADQKPLADKAAGSLTAKGAALKELLDAYNKSLELEQKAETPAQKELERKNRERIKKDIQDLDFGPEADIMSKMGMDPASLKKLNFQLKETFNLKEIEWQGAQESLQKTLDAAKLTATVTLTPDIQQGIDFAGAAKAMGMDVESIQSPADLMQQSLTKATESLKRQDALTKDVALQTDNIKTSATGVAGRWQDASKALREYKQAAVDQARVDATSTETVGFGARTVVDEKQFAESRAAIDQSELKLLSFMETYAQFSEQLNAGKLLTDEQMVSLMENTNKLNALPAKGMEKWKESMQKMAKDLNAQNEALQKQQEGMKEQTDRAGEFKAADGLIQQVELIGGKLLEMKAKIDANNQSIQGGADGFGRQKGAVDDTKAAADVLNGATAGLVPTIQSATNAYYAMADAAWAAADAGAAAAGANAYSGGNINFLAAGGRGKDRIPTMLSAGEFVSSARTTAKFFSELNAMNNGGRPVYREQGGSVTTVGDVNVTVKGGDTAQATVREIGHALRREIQRGNIKLK